MSQRGPRFLFALALVAGNACVVGEGWLPGGGEHYAPSADERPRAVGAAVDEIAVYQAVKVTVVEAGARVAPAQRSAQLVTGRDALVRVYVDRDAKAPPRDWVARLDVAADGASAQVYGEAPVTFAAGAARAEVKFRVAGADIRQATRFSLSIVDAGPDPPAGDSSRARWPRQDGALDALDALSSRGIEVVVVPMKINDTAAPSANAAAMAELMQAMYPLPEGGISVRVAAPVELTLDLSVDPSDPLASWFGAGHPYWMLDGVIAELRRQRQSAQSSAYYYGLVDHSEIFGFADGIPSPVAYGTTNDGIVTFAHELGHNFGLRHAPCGGAGGPDPSYPHSGARIGVEGWDPRSEQFYDEKVYVDIMSYCSPLWISDYSFRRVHQAFSSAFAMPDRALAQSVTCDFTHGAAWD